MKKLLFLLAIGLAVGVNAQELVIMMETPLVNSIEKSGILWEEDIKELGEVKQNVPVTVEFQLKNVGEIPLLITNVKPSCGCTTGDFTKEPISPGECTTISATYNAKTLGTFSKTITVTTNLEDQPKQLTLRGVVVE